MRERDPMAQATRLPGTDPVPLVRHFNRFYTRRLRLLERGHLGSQFSLSEVRLLYEIAHRTTPTAREIGEELGLDPGYLSRMLLSLRRRGLVRAEVAGSDRRRRALSLTEKGRKGFDQLNLKAGSEIRAMLGPLAASELEQLVGAMRQIESLLDDRGASTSAGPRIELRAPEPGDLGWVVQRHGELYATEYGWDARFERLVARIVGEFATTADGSRQRAWIATLDGRRAGCIFLTEGSPTLARLRLLLVEPWARGHGIGSLLVDACLAAARSAGYRRMTLWTNGELHAARRLYQRTDFKLIKAERHNLFGEGLEGQTWERDL